jgi:hypothetical protein
MKTAKELITLRFNYKHTRKDGTLQVLFEIKNFSPAIIRISALNANREIIRLKPNQLTKGQAIGFKEAFVFNQYVDKTKNKIRLSIDFLKFFNLPVTKQNIEKYTYFQFSDVFHFFENNVAGDEDQIKEFITRTFVQTPEQNKTEDQQDLLKQFELDILQPTALLEAMDFYKFENITTHKIRPFVSAYCNSINTTDILIKTFNAQVLENIVNYCIQNPVAKGKKYYAVGSIKGFIKHIKIFFKTLKKEGYDINAASLAEIYDYQLRQSTKSNAQIQYVFDEKQNVFSINYVEFEAIKQGIYNKKLSKVDKEKLEKTRKLFIIETLLGGLRYSELLAITKDSFVQVNGKYFLYLKQGKTGKMIDSPLHNELTEILEAINYNIQELVWFGHNYQYNDSLRLMAELLGLNREIVQLSSNVNQQHPEVQIFKLHELFTSKVARKALVTLLFNKGYSIEQIATITKHSINAIQHYIAILQNSKAEMINTI